ncbi:MAG TPA: M10 family metallopeptidase C-terminal domain-containing protein [Caulobacteraceae bacterium]|jgi:serralysin
MSRRAFSFLREPFGTNFTSDGGRVDGPHFYFNDDQRGLGTGNGKPSLNPDAGAQQVARPGVTWGAGAVVTYAFRSTAPATMPGEGEEQTSGFERFNSLQIQAAELALQVWADVANITFQRVGSGLLGEAAYSDTATMLFANYTAGAPGAAAFANYPGSTDPGAVAGDLWFNITQANNITPTFSGGRGTLLHEIGHAIGLAHPGAYDASDDEVITYPTHAEYYEDSRQYSVMSYFSEANTGANFGGWRGAAPMLDDITAVQRQYGANMTTRTGDTTYGFNSNTGRDVYSAGSGTPAMIFAVWDAGGFDTLDFSGYAQDQVIDLRQGHFSNVGGLIGNVAVAYGASIERAIGGSGADTMYAAANIVSSGGGADLPDLVKAQSQANHSRDAALSVDGTFDLVANGQIAHATTIPHATVRATAAGGGLEYYAFTVTNAGARAIFDIDGGNAADMWIELYDAAGTRIVSNDDAGGDAGSSARTDSQIAYTFAAPGTYYVAVGRWTAEGQTTAVPLLAGAAYTLHLSVAGAATPPVPAPVLAGSTLEGKAGNDRLIGAAADDSLLGGDGDDRLGGGSGGDLLQGDAGFDFADYAGAGASVTVFLAGPWLNTGDAVGDTYASIEGIIGSGHADLMGGDDAGNVLYGEAGNDWLFGGGGNDGLVGGAGHDLLEGGAGGDWLDGGDGLDAASYRNALSGVIADMRNTAANAGEAAGDGYGSIENLWGSDFSDVIVGHDGGGQVYGFFGDDYVFGYGGDDNLYGGGGVDYLAGGTGGDTFFFLQQSEGGDTIADFVSGQDIVFASQYWFGFTVQTPGRILDAQFVSGTAPAGTGSGPQFLWDSDDHRLWYDEDGAGAAGPVLLATFAAGTTMTAADIWTA